MKPERLPEGIAKAIEVLKREGLWLEANTLHVYWRRNTHYTDLLLENRRYRDTIRRMGNYSWRLWNELVAFTYPSTLALQQMLDARMGTGPGGLGWRGCERCTPTVHSTDPWGPWDCDGWKYKLREEEEEDGQEQELCRGRHGAHEHQCGADSE